MFIAILVAILVLSVIIIVHELGHFFAAKAVGVKVEEFGIGYPPRLLSFQWGETRYSLNAIPFGGFNKLVGEEDPSLPRSLASKSIPARLLVISAGSIMNVILPLLLLSIAFMIPHNMVVGEVTVKEVAPDSPAAAGGILAGDTLVSINGREIYSIYDLQRNTQLNLGKEVTLVVTHSDASTEEIRLTPRWKPPEGQGPTGTTVSMEEWQVIPQSTPFWQVIPQAFSAFGETFILYKNGIITLIIGAAPATMVGPVGMVQMTAEVASAGISPLLEFAAMLSLLIAIFQLFPLPALDSGRIAFILLEWVRRGKRVPARVEGMIHLVGFFLLLAVMLAVTYQDIVRIISGDSLIP